MKRIFSKHFLPPKTLSISHNCLWTAKTGSSAAGTFSYSRNTRFCKLSTTPTAGAQLLNGFKATKLHYSLSTTNNFRAHLKNKRVGKKHALHNKTARTIKSFYICTRAHKTWSMALVRPHAQINQPWLIFFLRVESGLAAVYP